MNTPSNNNDSAVHAKQRILTIRVPETTAQAWQAAASREQRSLAACVRVWMDQHEGVKIEKEKQAQATASKSKASTPVSAKWIHPTELLQEKPLPGVLSY